MGGTIYVLAGNVYNWQVQHNVLHHTYTNILGMMKILMQENNSLYKEAKWHNFIRFNYYSVFFIH
jgi:linoleoyl-CoA desaturase